MKRLTWRAARAAWQRPLPQQAASCSVVRWGGVDGVRSASTSGHGSGIPKGLNTSNPFEIKFHIDDAPADAAEELAGIESCFFEDEVEKFHSEMIGVFGSEPEEHDDGGGENRPSSHVPTPSSQYSRATSVPPHTVVAPKAIPSVRPATSVRHVEPVRLARSPLRTSPSHLTSTAPSIKLIQGPCTYVHDGWVGSKDRWSVHEVETMVGRLAQTHGLHVEPYHSNHEGQILDWLLATSPGDKIILNWNGRLADSPVVYRALSSIHAFVVVLAPLDVELGPLPPSVKGVISGLGTRSLELAIQACK